MATVTQVTTANFLAADNTGDITDLITSSGGDLTVEGSFACTSTSGAPVLYYSLDGGLTRTAVSVTYTSGTSGSFSFTTAFSTGDGSLSFWLEPSDGFGDQSVGVFAYSVTGSGTASTTINSVTDNVAGGTEGTLSSGAQTNDTMLTLEGNAAAGSTVVITNGSTTIGTVTADVNGAWKLTTASLSNGSYAFIATSTDLAGNSSSSAAFNVTVDATAPGSPTGLTLRTGSDAGSTAITSTTTSATTLFLHGGAEAGSTVAVYDGGTLLGTATADGTGKWVFALPTLENGTGYNFRASTSDAAGNSSEISTAIALTVISSPSDAPQIINIADDVTNGAYADTGSIANGGISNDTTLTLTGVAAAGITVNIYDGATYLDSVTSDASTGAWVFTTAALATGAHSFTVTTTTSSGIESAASDAWIVTTDTTAPAKPGTFTVTDDVGLRTGSLAVIGTVTDDDVLTLSGTAEAGAKVYIYDNGSSTALGVVEADQVTGAWVFQTADLSDGAHSLRVMASDQAGNESALSDAFTLTVDTTTPAAPTLVAVKNGSTTLTSGTFNQASAVELSGTATANATVVVYNGAEQLSKVTADASGNWVYNATGLSDGTKYTWSVKAENSAGTLSAASNSFSLTIDRTAPLIGTTTDLITNSFGPLLKEASGAGQVIYTAVATDLDAVSWSLTGADAGEFAVSNAGVVSLVGNPDYETKTSYNFNLVATDSAGNTTTKALTLGIQNVDEVAPIFGTPTVDVESINANSGANQLIYDATATDTDGDGVITYSLGGADAALFTIEPDSGKVYLIENPENNNIADRVLNFTVIASDAAGNTTTSTAQTLAIKFVDTVAPVKPTITGVFDAAGTTNLGAVLNASETSGTVVVKGTAEAGSTVAVLWGANPAKTVTADATNGTWSVTFSSSEIPADSPNVPITATATDTAGNVSDVQVFDNLAIDRVITQPTLSPITADGVINAAEAQALVLSGTTEAGSTLTLNWNGKTYTNGSGPNDISIDENGVWSLAIAAADVPAGTGSSTLTLSAVDAAGNVSTALIQAIAYDRVAPTVTVTDNLAGTANTTTGSIAYTYQFSEAVTGLEAADFTLANGAISSINGSGTTYTVTVTPSQGVASGTIDLTLQAGAVQDAAGNTNSANSNTSQALDTLAPTGLTLNAVASDDIVNATEKSAGFTIGGAVEAGTSVSVLWGNQTRAATVTGSTWSLTYATNQIPTDGAQLITVTATDPAGNTSQLTRSITVDTVAPTATVSSLSFSADSGSSASDFNTNTASQTISGVLSSLPGTGEVVEVSLDNGTNWSTAALTSTPTGPGFTLAGQTLAGSNTLQVRVRDAAGNLGATRSQTYVLDTEADNKTVTAAGIVLSADTGVSTTDRITRTASQTFTGNLSGNVLAGDRVQFSLNGGTTWGTATTSTNRTNFSFTGALANGDNTIKVRHLDAAGNASTEYSTVVKLDTGAPTVTAITVPNASGGAYKLGDAVNVTVQFSEAVLVTGKPQLSLQVGANARLASYTSGTNSNTLTFLYTIAAGDIDTDGISINVGALNLNRGTISDAAGNAALITNTAVAANANTKVDSALPTLASTEVVDGQIVLTFSEDLAGTNLTQSFFTLSTGGPVTAATVSGKTVTLTPTSTISASSGVVTVSYNDGSTLDLTSGTIQDLAGNDAATFSNAAATKVTAAGSITLATTTSFTTAVLTGTNGDALTGNAAANTLIGNTGDNNITGAGGGDTLTGLGGADRFIYTANNNSLLASFDRITDFVIGTDSIDAVRTSAALGASKGSVTALTSAAISAVLTNTSFAATTNAAWFTFGTGATQRTFLALNDGVRGFSASTDAIIEMTGVTGNMANLTVI